MLRLLTVGMIAVALYAAPVAADEGDAAVPDLTELDRDTLQAVAEQLYQRVAALEGEIEELRSALEGGDEQDGGSEAQWHVTVLKNAPPDLTNLKEQLEEERSKVARGSAFNRELQAAQDRVLQMENAKEDYIDNRGRRRTRSKYNANDLIQPKADLRSLEREERATKMAVRRLEQQIARSQSEREISVQLEDGRHGTLVARGVFFELGASMQEGETYVVNGPGSLSADAPLIRLRSVLTTDESDPSGAIAVDEP